tara:strand:- start:66 stop:263 length:198 start_codon:yes stop_codon:yes gene_type:complete
MWVRIHHSKCLISRMNGQRRTWIRRGAQATIHRISASGHFTTSGSVESHGRHPIDDSKPTHGTIK